MAANGASSGVFSYLVRPSETRMTSRSSSSHTQLISKVWPPSSLGRASFLVAMMECEICGAEVIKQPVRVVDIRKDPDRIANRPPPRCYAVAVIPYQCPKCGHEQYRRV
jgi:hypothetical protein